MLRLTHTLDAGSHRRRAATAVTVILGLSGVICIGLATADQQHPPRPPLWTEDPAGSQAGESASARPAHTKPRVKGPVLATSAPVALAIPAIDVRSRLLHLGLAADGSMEVPSGTHYNLAGWYRYSPAPGALGPAIITGHVDSAAQGPSVFFRLGSLRPHDTVLITRADRSVAVFAVDDVRRYPKRRFPLKLVYGNTNHAALRLITCGGAFDRASGHYLDNIVVTASLEGARTTTSKRTAAVS
jgi:hypothetical protein